MPCLAFAQLLTLTTKALVSRRSIQPCISLLYQHLRTNCLNSFFKAFLQFGSWKLLCFTFLILFESISAFGQIVLLSPTGDGGFETGATFAANGWTTVNPNASLWEVGTGAIQFAGNRGAYTK
jgi:hypothetical protein